ncbi:MAG: glutathione S-transferase C-terminal domain-containing protein, partial [Kangiellaceae bacterium]|nr:glutathione S-transferase C-terminal domain-containing protein [Kangiellaceae bacterium]
RTEIDKLNKRIYHTVNNGVYRAGFATTQKAYDEAVYPLFETLDYLEHQLSKSRFLLGEQPTEVDWRLFPTLFRFDPIYVGHFKCSKKRIKDYENLSRYIKDLYQWEGISETVNLEHAINHYYQSHESINPHRIVPINNQQSLG